MRKLLSVLSTIILSTNGFAVMITKPNQINLINKNIVSISNVKLNDADHIDNWKQANPARSETITQKTGIISDTVFSPYIDGGLVSNNDLGDVQYFAPNLDSATLAFVQQANDIKDHLHLTVAGIPSTSEDYTNTLLAKNIYKPLASKNNLEKMVISYGGANGSKLTNPWSVALKMVNGDVEKARPMLIDAITEFSKSVATLAGVTDYYPKNLDFDLEGGTIVTDIEDIQFLIDTLVIMKKQDNTWNFTFTLPVLPTGLTDGQKILDMYVKAWKEAGFNLTDLPITNLMTMDYGESFYNEKITNFTLAKAAVDSTKNQLNKAIETYYGAKANDEILYPKLGATPMIGINDVKAGVFTLEDAKELYNWANEVNLGTTRIWSLNDDSPIDINGTPNKTLFCHGLNYLQMYDFIRAFTGEWNDLVMNPYTSPDNHEIPPTKKDIKKLIHTSYLGYINGFSGKDIINEINLANNTNFKIDDILVTDITDSGADLLGRGLYYEGNVWVSFAKKNDISKWITNNQNQLDLGKINDNSVNTIIAAIEAVVVAKGWAYWVDFSYINLNKINDNKYLMTSKDSNNRNNPYMNSIEVVFTI